MGDKYMRTKAPIQEQKKKRFVCLLKLIFCALKTHINAYLRKKKADEEDFRIMSKSVIGDNTELMGSYKPRTQETKQTYEVILAFIQEAIGDQVITISSTLVLLLKLCLLLANCSFTASRHFVWSSG